MAQVSNCSMVVMSSVLYPAFPPQFYLLPIILAGRFMIGCTGGRYSKAFRSM